MNNLLTQATFVIQQRTAEQRLFSLRSLLASARCCLHARASIIIQELFKNYSRIVQELFNNYSRIMATCLFNFAIILPSSLASVSDKLRCAPVDDATRFSVQTSVSSSSIFRSQIAVMLVNCIGRRRVAAVSMLTRANLCRAIYFKSASVPVMPLTVGGSMTIQCSQYVYLTSLRQHPVTAYTAHRPGLRLVRLLLNSFSGLLHLLQHQALAHTSRHQGALRLFHFQAAHAYARVAPTAALYQKEKHATWTAQLTVNAVITNSFTLRKRRLLSISSLVPIARSFTPSTSLREPRHRAASRQRRACTHALVECMRISSSSSRPMLESPNAPAPVLANAVASVQLPGPRQWARSYRSADTAFLWFSENPAFVNMPRT